MGSMKLTLSGRTGDGQSQWYTWATGWFAGGVVGLGQLILLASLVGTWVQVMLGVVVTHELMVCRLGRVPLLAVICTLVQAQEPLG